MHDDGFSLGRFGRAKASPEGGTDLVEASEMAFLRLEPVLLFVYCLLLDADVQPSLSFDRAAWV